MQAERTPRPDAAGVDWRGRKFGELTPAEQRKVTAWAGQKMQAELEQNAEAIAEVLELTPEQQEKSDRIKAELDRRARRVDLITVEDIDGVKHVLDLAPGDILHEPWVENCEGCDGTGHLGRRVEPLSGPCEACLGAGRVMFAFHHKDGPLPRTSLVPQREALLRMRDRAGIPYRPIIDRAVIARAEALGFVREPTLGGDEGYDAHLEEDAAEAREWLAHRAWRAANPDPNADFVESANLSDRGPR